MIPENWFQNVLHLQNIHALLVLHTRDMEGELICQEDSAEQIMKTCSRHDGHLEDQQHGLMLDLDAAGLSWNQKEGAGETRVLLLQEHGVESCRH